MIQRSRLAHTKLSLVTLFMLFLLVGVGYTQQTPTTPTPAADAGRRGAVEAANATATAQPAAGCDFAWFFTDPTPTSCPVADAVSGETTLQRFQYGYMVWTEPDDMIYVIHISHDTPRWFMAEDPFVAGMPERDNAWDEPQPPQTIQPRFGFGALWREDDDLRARIGWAIQEWEFVYDGRVQVAVDDTIYLEDHNGSLFELLPDGENWSLYR